MTEQFQLLHYGKLSLIEQNWMTAEDRAWWLKKTEQDIQERAEAEKKQHQSMPRSRTPRRR